MRAAEDTELNFIRHRAFRGRRSPRKRGRVKTEILWSADSYDKFNNANLRKKRNEFVVPAYLGASTTKKKGPNVRQHTETFRRTLVPNIRYDIVPEEKIYARESQERSKYEADNIRMLDCCARHVRSDSSVSSRDSFRTEEFTDTSQYSRKTRCRWPAKSEEEATDHKQTIIIESQEESRHAAGKMDAGAEGGIGNITADSLSAVMKAVDAALKYTQAAIATKVGKDGGGGGGGGAGAAQDHAPRNAHDPPGCSAPRESVAVGTGELAGANPRARGEAQETGSGWTWEAGPAPAAPPGERTRSVRPATPVPAHTQAAAHAADYGPAHAHAPHAGRTPFHTRLPRVPPANVTDAIAAAASAQPVAVSASASSRSSGNSGSDSEKETIHLAKVAARAVDAAGAAAEKHLRVEKMETGLWPSMEQDEAALRAQMAAADASQGHAHRKKRSQAGGGSTPQSVCSADGNSQGDVNVHIRLVASNGVLKAQAVLTNAEGAAYEVPTSVEWDVPSPGAWREVRSTLSAMHCSLDPPQQPPPPLPPSALYASPPASTAPHARSDQARVLYSHVPSPPPPPPPVAQPAAAASPRRRSRGATVPAQQFSPTTGERSGGYDGSPIHAGDTLNKRSNEYGASAERHMDKSGPRHRAPSHPIIVPLDISRFGFGVNPVTQQIFVARPIPTNDSEPNSPSFSSIPQDQSHLNSNSAPNCGPDPSCTFNSPPPGNFRYSLHTEQIPGMDRRPLQGSVFTSHVEPQHQHYGRGSPEVSVKSLESHWPYNTPSKGEYSAPPPWQHPSQIPSPHFHATSSPRPSTIAAFWNNSEAATCLSGLRPRPGYVEVYPHKMVHSEPPPIHESYDTNIGKAFFKEAEMQGNSNDPNLEAMKFETVASLFRKLSNIALTANEQEIYQSNDTPNLTQMSKTEPMVMFSNSDHAQYLNPTRNAFHNNPFISCSEITNLEPVIREETTMFSTTEQNVYPNSSEKYSHPFLNQTTTLPNPYKTINNDKSNYDNIFTTTQQGGENPYPSANTSTVPPLTTKQLNEFPFLQAKYLLDAPGAHSEPRPSEQWLSFLEAKQAQWWQARRNGPSLEPPGHGYENENELRDGRAGAGFSPLSAREAAPSAEAGRVSWLQLRSLLDDMRARNQHVAAADARDGSSADGALEDAVGRAAFAPASALPAAPTAPAGPTAHHAPPWPPVPG